MMNTSTIRLILAVSLAVLLFAGLPYQGFDVVSPAWAGKGDKKGDGGGKGKGSKSRSGGDTETTSGSDAGSGGDVAGEATADTSTSNADTSTSNADTSTSTNVPGDATANPTVLLAPDESNDDDERRRGANFFVGLDAYKQGDFDLALSHWLPLAENGHAVAQTGLGAVYYTIEQHAAAFRWSLTAARQGESDAAHNLAVLYQYGLGTPFSMSQAMLWYGEAASRGNRKATLALRELRGGPLAGFVVPVPVPKPDQAESPAAQRRTEDAQILLASLGYDPGPIDGRLGARTKAAVEQFERDRALFIRGRVNQALLVNLRRAIVDDAATVISTR